MIGFSFQKDHLLWRLSGEETVGWQRWTQGGQGCDYCGSSMMKVIVGEVIILFGDIFCSEGK